MKMANHAAVNAIADAVNTINNAQKATGWLETYGGADPGPGAGGGGMFLDIKTASSVDGFKEANYILNNVVRDMWPQIVAEAKARAAKLNTNATEIIQHWADKL